jgi:urease accessory protein UreH
MLTTAYVKTTVDPNASIENIPQDVMVFGVAARLEATQLLALRAASKTMNKLATADDI